LHPAGRKQELGDGRAKSNTIAAAGAVASANPQLTHGQTLRPRLTSPRAGSAAL
jgi:hypothetical protein